MTLSSRPKELQYDAGCGRALKTVDPAPADVRAADLVEVGQVKGAAFNVIGFHPREVVDMLAPVQVSPPPTHMIRILMDATPVEECPALDAPVLPEAVPLREGFTVVEWGGVLRESR